MTLQDHFPEIPLEEMLTWACTNGAKALGMDDRYGTLEVGKKPGIAGITACDIQNLRSPPKQGKTPCLTQYRTSGRFVWHIPQD